MWSEKSKVSANDETLYLDQFQYAEIDGQEMYVLGKFGPKNQNCQFNMKFGIYTYLNMLNLMVMFNCPVLDWKYPFLANLVLKFKITYLR